MNHTTDDFSSIPELSKKQLQDLFLPEEDNQWCRCIPKDKESLKCTPSSSEKSYSTKLGCERKVKDYLKKAFEKVFIRKGNVESFWDDFILNVTHKLGLTYRKARMLKVTLPSYSEAQLQQNILNPLLKEVSKAASIIPDIEEETIKTDFSIQYEIEMHEGRSGQKPAVDAMILVSKRDDKVVTVACVPVEMKKEMEVKHYSQLACYMNKLSTAEDLATNSVMVGIIIDNRQFRLAFSVYKLEGEKSSSTPLPIVCISPPIQWRSETNNLLCNSLIQPQSMLTLACTFLIGQLKRLHFSDDYQATFPGKPSAKDIIEMGDILMKNRHKMHKAIGEFDLVLKKQVEEQRNQLEEQQRKIARFEEKLKKIDEDLEIMKEALFSKKQKIDTESCT